MELTIRYPIVLRIWWAWMWRYLLTAILTVVVSSIVGFFVGLGGQMLGIDQETLKYAGVATGVIIWFFLTILPIKLILNQKFGKYRVCVVAAEETEKTEPPPSTYTP